AANPTATSRCCGLSATDTLVSSAASDIAQTLANKMRYIEHNCPCALQIGPRRTPDAIGVAGQAAGLPRDPNKEAEVLHLVTLGKRDRERQVQRDRGRSHRRD